MRARAGPTSWAFLAVLTCAGGCATVTGGGAVPVLRVNPDAPLGSGRPAGLEASSLQRALQDLAGPARVLLAPGEYHLRASDFTDPTCGNCEIAETPVPGTVGLVLRGRGIELVGASADSVVVHTNAGYGVLFAGCERCGLRGITVTGGVRDPDGRATNGAVVVRDGSVTLERCVIRDNVGDSATVAAVVVGIAGVVGREGSDITVSGCRIERSSWDGIALYRGARAEIRDNVVDGVDKASGARVGGGRGVGIGLTWDATATVERNLVRRYWKGIGVFVDARAVVRHNVVEDILTWGIAYWGAASGEPQAWIEDNVIFRTGACGAMIERRTVSEGGPAPGSFSRNVLVRTTQNPRYDSGEPYCPQRPIARVGVPDGFRIDANLVHDVRQPGAWEVEPEVSAPELRARAPGLIALLQGFPVLRHAIFFSDFWDY